MRELFIWGPIYELGVPEIDNQHKHWLQIMNKLYHLFMKENNKQELTEILNEISDYVEFHFRFEEDFFNRKGVYHSATHLKAHSNFIIEMEKIRKKMKKDPDSITYTLMEFMESWLNEHILISDKQCAEELLSLNN